MHAATKRKLKGSTARVPAAAPPPTAAPQPAGKVLLSHADLLALGITYSRQHLYRLMAAGAFPRPVALGSEVYARKAWRRADVEAWIAALS